MIEEISTSVIISGILSRYNLEETDEDLAKKFFADDKEEKENNGQILLEVAITLNNKQKTEAELTDTLTKKLNTDAGTSERIMIDIKKELLPIIDSLNKNSNLASKATSAPKNIPKKSTFDASLNIKKEKFTSDKKIKYPKTETQKINKKDAYRESI